MNMDNLINELCEKLALYSRNISYLESIHNYDEMGQSLTALIEKARKIRCILMENGHIPYCIHCHVSDIK